MCIKTSLNQIEAAIENLKNAKASPNLIDAQTQAFSFIQAAAEADEITKQQKVSFERQVRKIYRNQLIEESA